MKSVITSVAIIAVTLCPGAASARGQQPPEAPAAPAALAPPPEEEELARVQEQVKREIAQAQEAAQAAKVEAEQVDAAATDAQAQRAKKRIHEQLARAQQAVELAQATAPVAAGLAGEPAPPNFQTKLHSIVHRGGGGPGRTLVIRTSDADAKGQANLGEDLAVMSRILDKALAQKSDDDRQNRFMGIDVLFSPGGGPVRSVYLEGYGAVFLLNVNFPLLPPPEKPQQAKEKSETDSAWDEAKREVYGQRDDRGEFGKAIRAYTDAFGGVRWGSRSTQAYDENKVSELKDALLEALKNATNIRNLKSDEAITVCVFGGASSGPRKTKAFAKDSSDDQDRDENELAVVSRDDGPPARGTIMTIRVKKADVDAFAKSKLNLDDFRKKASVTTYTGDTGGWGGANLFGIASP